MCWSPLNLLGRNVYLRLEGAREVLRAEKFPIQGGLNMLNHTRMSVSFWFSMWLSVGKPDCGEVYWNMRHSKNQYKYAVRRLRRAKSQIQNDKFVSSIIEGKVNIFKEIKKYRGNSSTISSRIDEEVGAENIANHFATIYRDLYNKVRTW